MEDPLSRAQLWLRNVVREEIWSFRLLALWHITLALSACFIWFFLWVAAFFLCGWILVFAGIPVPSLQTVGMVGIGFQLLFTPWLARVRQPRWTFTVSADETEILALAPESRPKLAVYDQDHDFSFRRTFAAIFLAAPIALANAWHDLRRIRQLKRLELKPAARLAADLIQRQEKVTFNELLEMWEDEGLLDALETASELSAFQIFKNEPQGVALTSSAVDRYLAT